ncbi:MAG: peptidylprolyl isomerase [Rhodothermales bacterium]
MSTRKLRTLAVTSFFLQALITGCSNAQQDSPAAGVAPADTTENQSTPMNTAPSEGNYYEISTPKGRMVVRLYDDTPEHRDNFARLANEGYYDGTTFHRVIANFMIQGGDPNSKNDDPMDDGAGGPGYTLSAEINPAHFHKRGALAAARQGDVVNPTRASSGSQFYLVLGGAPFDSTTLDQIERSLRTQIPDPGFTFSDSARAAYMRDGGAPHLDGMYTVFGEVVEGFDVLDAIGNSPTARSTGKSVQPALVDQPFDKIVMQVKHLENYTPPQR